MTLHELACSLVIGLLVLGCTPTTAQQQASTQQPGALPGLPERMGSGDITVGIDHLKPRMIACAKQAGVTADETMDIKFWIEGNTGSVQSAELLSPLDPSLATCVAQVIETAGPAVFPRFATERQGFTFKFRTP